MTNEQVLSKIIRIIWDEKTVPTNDDLIEAVEDMQRQIRRNNQLDSVKAVRGWKQVEMCCECGTTSTLEEIASTNPKALSCCPERNMISTMVPAGYGNVAEAATRNFVQNVGDILRCPSAVTDYPQILTALHDVIDNSNKKSAEIRKLQEDLDGVSRTLRIVNGAVDSLVELVGAKDPGDMRNKISGMMDRCRVLDEADEQGLMGKVVFLPVGLKMETADLITTFAENLAQRLVYKQRNGKDGWSRDDWREECLRRLHTAEKPLDVAAFAVFAWYHDWAGSYEGLVGETSVVHNHITINVEGNINGADLLSSLVNKRQDAEEAPAGFRTEPAADLYRRIANNSAVDEALRELVSDSTDENGLLVVESVYLALLREGKIK